MSATAGWVDWESDMTRCSAAVQRMIDAMKGQGPDASGLRMYRHAAIGHTRLAAAHPEWGEQPAALELGSRTLAIVYSGHLFNASELRSELEVRGHSFRECPSTGLALRGQSSEKDALIERSCDGHPLTGGAVREQSLRRRSDEEVLLHAFIEWGRDFVHKLDGFYAFAIWSEDEQRLFLCRDRLGVKPLFYAHLGNGLLFASEPKGLLSHPDMGAELDHEGVAEVFGLGPGRTPGHGVYKGVREIRPGFCLEFDRAGARLKRYWKLVSKPHLDDPEATAEKIRFLVEDSVRRQIPADSPVSVMLSGGLDSSIVTLLAASELEKQARGRLHTYSVEYDGNDRHFIRNDFQPDLDSPWIEQVSSDAKSCHHVVTLSTDDLFGSLTDALLARDMPGMADVDSSLLLFSREIRKCSAVALSGECADEFFGGYPWFHRREMLNADTFPWSRSVSMRTSLLHPDLREVVDLEHYVERRYRETLEEVPRLIGEGGLSARIREVFFLTIAWFMPVLIDRNDRMGSAGGLQIRAPYCDHRLVEYVWNVPWEMKTHGGLPKGILRKALAGVLPEAVLARRKSPFPKTYDPHYYALCKERLLEILSDKSSPLNSLVDSGVIGQILSRGGRVFSQPWFGQLMTDAQLLAYLIQVDTWMREYRISLC